MAEGRGRAQSSGHVRSGSPLAQKEEAVVEWEIGFDDLSRELIVALTANPAYLGIVAFGFWLASSVSHAFMSQKMVLGDIAQLWLRTNANEAIKWDLRERLNFRATDAFIAVTQHQIVADCRLPRLTYGPALELLNAALRSSHRRPTAIYTMAVILYLGTPTQVTTVTNEIKGSLIHGSIRFSSCSNSHQRLDWILRR